jgi:starch synthase
MAKLKVLFLSYECAPFMKMGGLGDVALGLPKALTKLGVDCRVIMPKYQVINAKKYKLKLFKKNISVKLKTKTEYIDLYTAKLPKSKTPIYFISHRYFQTKNIFGYKNDKERFFFFNQAALEALKMIKFQANILHCNDWHTGMVPLLLKKLAKQDNFYKKIKTIYSIHNMGYQGKAKIKSLKQFNIAKDDLLGLSRPNPMAQGIMNAHLVGTVSKTYAQEILTKEYGEGLEKFLRRRKKQGRLFGIVNGLDYEIFNPATDKYIKENYRLKTIHKKMVNKVALQKLFGLEINPNIPIIGAVSRITRQKGLKLILHLLQHSKELDYQFVLLGNGDKRYEQQFREVAKKYPKNISVKIMFSADLAQDIYAGADLFLMPSRYEPCGLGQLIAMRYGTVPIVRQTGGLKDTIVNYKNRFSKNKATGFMFKKYNPAALDKAIRRAIKIYYNKKIWDKLVRNCMSQDFSWEYSAKEYVRVYKRILQIG